MPQIVPRRFAQLAAKEWPRYVLLAAIGALVHLPALTGQFIWDDGFLARDNPFIKSPLLVFEAFRHHLFLDSFSGHYRPVQNLSFMFDYFWWNTESAGFHLTNITLHVGSGLLLYRLLRCLFRPQNGICPNVSTQAAGLVSFAVAACWIIHPVHSAAVDYISGRADSLAFLFASAAWLLVFAARGTNNLWKQILFYAAAMLAGFLALGSREIALAWLALFLLHTFFFAAKQSLRTKLANFAAVVLLTCAYAGVRHLAAGRPTVPGDDSGFALRLVLALRALGDYSRLMLWPAKLHMERTVFDIGSYRDHLSWRVSYPCEYLSFLGLLALSVCGIGCCRAGTYRRLRCFGAFWFFIGFLPISNLIPLNATVAEHWLYLPSVGFLIFLAGCLAELKLTHWKPLLATTGVIALSLLGARSAIRSTDWRDEETFYRRTWAAGGVSSRMAVCLAQVHTSKHEYAEAEKLLRHVIQLIPDYPVARNNLAYVLLQEGKTDEGRKFFSRSSEQAAQTRHDYPRTWIAACNVARVQTRQHDDEGAIATLERAHADYPEVWELISLQSELLRRKGRSEAALSLVEEFSAHNWWHHAAALAAGKLYAQKGDVSRALDALKRAALLDVHDVEALNLTATIYSRENHYREACATQRTAVARQPYEPTQYLLLSDILSKMGRSDEAQSNLARMAELRNSVLSKPAS